VAHFAMGTSGVAARPKSPRSNLLRALVEVAQLTISTVVVVYTAGLFVGAKPPELSDQAVLASRSHA
jgi:hypothetical protein